ncbi:MAG TPA: hypothetical protein VH720_09390 [Candidatus Limnocylindrales bacterium]|jgi:hypothetical protein
MRFLGFYLADVALRTATAPSEPVAEPPDAAMAVTDEQIRAWRSWRLEGERERAGTRVRSLTRVSVSRPQRASGG